MPVQMRLSKADDRLYSPDRDLAHCSVHLLHNACQGLDPTNQEPWIKDYLKANNVTDEDLGKAADVLAKYFNKAMLDPKNDQPFDALKAAGFFELPQAVQTIVCAKVGQTFMCAIFPSVRDVTASPDNPPFSVLTLAEAAEKVNKKIVWYRTRSKFRRWIYDTFGF